MITAGVHTIPLADYVADPAPDPSLNSGTAYRLLNQSPSHAKAQHPRLSKVEDDATSRLDLGTVAHALLLEGDESRLVVMPFDDWRTKAAQANRGEAREHGKIPILEKDMAMVRAMVDVAEQAIEASELVEAWHDGTSEQTLLWQDSGIWCRSRPDRRSKDWRILFDFKTVAQSAHPNTFMRAIVSHGYDLQAALGLRGVRELKLADRTTFVFVVQEIDPPYAVSFVSLSPQWLELAIMHLSVAMSLWKGCLRTNEWPSYPARVAYVDPPGWYGAEWNAMQPEIQAEDIVT